MSEAIRGTTPLANPPGHGSGQTKVEQVRSFLRSKILDGTYAPGSKLEAERALVAQFNASRPTLNKAVSMLVAEGLLERVPGRGTFVRGTRKDRRLGARSARTGRLAFVFYEPLHKLASTRFYSRLLSSAYTEAQRKGYHLVLDCADRATLLVGQRGRPREVDGFLAVAVEDYPLIAGWRSAGMPVVLCDFEDPAGQFDAVVFDHASAGRAIASHLTAREYRRVGMINEQVYPHGATQAAKMREESLRNALGEMGGTLAEEAVVRIPDHSPRSIQLIREFLARQPRPRALVLFHDLYAPLLAKALADLGLTCPTDVAVASFATDDEPVAGLPSITGARFSPEALGSLAMAQLIERVERPEKEVTRLRLPPEFVLGGSA